MQLNEFGLLLDESWKMKKKLHKEISNNELNYIYDLINLYKSNDSYRKVIELYEEKNMTKELNDYIKNIIQDEYMFMFDDDNIEYYLDKYVISEESDIIFLLEKYVNLGKLNEIQKLLFAFNGRRELRFTLCFLICFLLLYCGLPFRLLFRRQNGH